MYNTITYFDSFGVEHSPKEIKSSSNKIRSQEIILEHIPMVQ